VQLTVYDYDGKVIEKLVDEEKKPGTYEIKFNAISCHSGLPPERDGESVNGERKLTGYYYYKMTAGDFTSEKKWLCINKLSGRLNMKALLQTLFFFFLVTQICFAQWEWQNPLPQGNDLNDVDFIDEFNGIAVGKSGTIIHTTDGGLTWSMEESGTTLPLNGVEFLDINNAWAIGGDYFYPSPSNFEGIILITTNGGQNWIQQYFSTDFMLNGICFLDSNNGWVVGGTFDTAVVLHTTDGGINWNMQTCGGISLLNAVCFTDINSGTVVGVAGIFRTTDGGSNWTKQTNEVWELKAVNFIDANNGWAVGGFTGLPLDETDLHMNQKSSWWTSIIHTTDGGTNWTIQLDTLDALLFAVSFLDSSFGFAVGQTPAPIPCSAIYSGIILRTKDGGTSWTIIDVPINTGWHSGFKDFCFTNEGDGVLIGNYGVILKSSNDGEIWDLKLNGTTNDLSGIEFKDANIGFAVGAEGTILRTTDSGTNWINQPSGTSLHLNDVCFPDENNGWIVGVNKDWEPTDSSIILHTTDGGISWLQQTTFVGTMLLFDLFFADENNGWAVGAEYSGDGDGVILRTTDGGVNWITSIIQPMTGWFHSVYFIDSKTGWACGSHDGLIVKTTNGGISWFNQLYSSYKGYRYIYFSDENNGWALSGDELIHSTDGGNHWAVQIPYNSTNSFSSIKFFDSNNGLIISNDSYDQNSRILKTSNGGATWYSMYVGSHRRLNEFYFENNNLGWIVGDNGTILHTTNGGISFVEEEVIEEVPTEFLLSQNYPNPFNPSTKIKYSVLQSSNVIIKVFDILGNEIETLINEEKPIGTYELNWNAANLPSGVYFYQLKAGSFVKTMKMLLLK